MTIALEIIAFTALAIPTAYELWNEKKGEPLKVKWLSMLVRVVIAVGSVWVAAVFKNDNLLLDLIKSGVMAFAIFILFFNPLINLILGREPWYSYLSQSSLDRLASKVNWKVRMGGRLVIFIASLTWFLWN